MEIYQIFNKLMHNGETIELKLKEANNKASLVHKSVANLKLVNGGLSATTKGAYPGSLGLLSLSNLRVIIL